MGVRTKRKLAKSCPPKVRALLRVVDDYKMASDVTGLSKSYIQNIAMGHYKGGLSKAAMTKVEKGIKRAKNGGKAPPASRSPAPVLGDNTSGFVVCFSDNKRLQALVDAGERFGGSWVWQKRLTGGKWIAMLKLDDAEKRATFAALAVLAGEIITP